MYLNTESARIQNTGGFKGAFYLKSLPGYRIFLGLGGCIPEESVWMQNTGEVGWLLT